MSGATYRGLKEWMVQRISAVYLLLYFIGIVIAAVVVPPEYRAWRTFWFHNIWMLTANILFLLALLLHAWIGVWTIITDYISCSFGRLFVKGLVWLALFGFFVYGVVIFVGLFASQGF